MTASKPARTIGVLAGGGNLPAEVIDAIRARGDGVHVLALDGAAGPAMLQYPHTVVRWGGIGRILSTLRDKTDGDLVFVGRVSRPDLRRLGPDLGFLVNLPALLKMMSGGDDAILTRVVRFFESKGVRVRGVHEVAPGLVAMPGPVGRLEMSGTAETDFRMGLAVLDALGPHDVGQAVVVADGRVLGIEAAEGTDRMLERVAGLRSDGLLLSPTKARGVLIKAPKRGQELRVDMPAIGPATVERAATAGLAGIAVGAGSVLIAERARVRDLADAYGVFIHGFDATAPSDDAAQRLPQTRISPLAGRALRHQDSRDIAKGAAVARALARFETGQGVVVSGRYVIAVAGPEGVPGMLRRVPQLRQWGTLWARRPKGVLVIRDVVLADADGGGAILAAAWQAGLAGVAIQASGCGSDVIQRWAQTCPKDRFIARVGDRGDAP